jgi:O-antigen/teichoic acid export membrane protein
LRSLFIVCLPVALIAILGILYQKTSLTMLSFLGTASMVGLFSAAMRILEAARIGHVAIFTALYPAMANTGDDNQVTFKFSWLFLMVTSIVGSMLLFLLAKPIVNLFFGLEYQPAITALKTLAFTLIPYTVNSLLSLMFLANNKEKIVLSVLGISLSVLLFLNFWFIPRAGQIGASWAVLIAESVQALLFLRTWVNDPFHQTDIMSAKGVSYELSDLS